MKLRLLAVVSVCCALATFALRASVDQSSVADSIASRPIPDEPRTPLELRRAPDQTFLTYPEWFLVYSPREFADVAKTGSPSRFPYLEHVGQFWEAYAAVREATRDDPFNSSYHVMIVVIGTSTTAEYALKWAYERVVGRFTEVSRRRGLTAEDQLAAEVAADYVAFLDVEPWYKFDFLTPLRRTWSDTGWRGPDPLRKWERKYALTTEYLVKAGYAWVIRKSSESQYGVQKPLTSAIVDRLPDAGRESIAGLQVIETLDNGNVLIELPRYQAFTAAAAELARHDVTFVEIAGNREPLLITAVVSDVFNTEGLDLLFTQPILTRPGLRRIAFVIPVNELTATVRRFQSAGARLEHVYDY